MHSSVSTSAPNFFRRALAFAGPAYLVSVGYMDPGNWASDLEGGSRFGYRLLWVIVASNAMAILLQTLAARLGIVTGRDLAQACRDAFAPPVRIALWVLCEIAIAACDLAEVLGAAIALKLLFGLPIIVGVVLTGLDTFLVLWLSRYGIRVIEGVILLLIATITGCFLVELAFARPSLPAIVAGLVPRLDRETIFAAVAILGATVMPHNLYLHSALVQTRRIGTSDEDRARACRFNLIDSVVALNGALIVNAAILVLSSAVFFQRAVAVTEIEQASSLLTPLLGTTLAGGLFAVALLASGQSSTLTGTYAGQIVMEGFLDLRMRPWVRRLATRSLAIAPAVLTVWFVGERGILPLILLSQVILSMQLPFAVIPLIRFTSDSARMGRFVSPAWLRLVAWISALLILGLNVYLVADATGEWLIGHPARLAIGAAIGLALLGLLLWVSVSRLRGDAPQLEPSASGGDMAEPTYRTILVPLDHSDRDRAAVAHASSMARLHGARLHLLHVEEGAISRLYGEQASTREVHHGERYFQTLVATLAARGIRADLTIVDGNPLERIVAAAKSTEADLIVMGAHGHRGVKDLIFGATINAVRHEVSIPVLVVGTETRV